ncbi:MBL fold metallo-hydrolase [Myroides injenensis]|uniref:MBL fold metallo-hydrolase n=1 Tax=Myroides injenensis TaxID=1183151 RepID=UPI002271FA9F|nr:MBL fold metallo-hydrolase [Myroides injenensis]
MNTTFKNINTEILNFEIFNAPVDTSFGVSSVIISGIKDAILIDALFLLEDAEKVATHIKESGKNLKAIYVSHGDPDFYFGLQVFKKYFPNVVVYATSATVEHIKETSQKKLEVWGERLGDALPNNIVLPQVLKGNTLELEGKELQIIGLGSHPKRTFIWIPSVKAIVGGINVFGTTFNLWMADASSADAKEQWLEVLDSMLELHPSIVVPSHANQNSSFDIKAIEHTKEYLLFYINAMETTSNSTKLIEVIKAQYPALTFEAALQLGAKVNKGEMKW